MNITLGDFMRLLEHHEPDESLKDVLQRVLEQPEIREVVAAVIKKNGEGRIGRANKTLQNLNVQPNDALKCKICEWAHDPAAFFKSWKLESSLAVRTFPINNPPTAIMRLKSMILQKADEMKTIESRRQEDNIRWIFNSLFFRDLVLKFGDRPSESSNLPKGDTIRRYVKKTIEHVCGDAEFAEEMIEWTKLGNLYHLIGDILGEGIWVLIPDYLASNSATQNIPRTLDKLTKFLLPIKTELNKLDVNLVSQAEKAARTIRELQIGPWQAVIEQIAVPVLSKRGKTTSKKRRLETTETQNQPAYDRLSPMHPMHDHDNIGHIQQENTTIHERQERRKSPLGDFPQASDLPFSLASSPNDPLRAAVTAFEFPEILFQRVRLPQKRWNENGEIYEVIVRNSGIDQRLVDIVLDINESGSVSEGLIEGNPDLTHTLDSENSLQIFQLICYVFPREDAWETSPTYSALVTVLFPLFLQALDTCQSRVFELPCVRGEASEVLLAASKVPLFRSQALDTVEKFAEIGLDLHQKVRIAYERSVFLRLNSEFDGSERIVHDFCCDCGMPRPSCISCYYRQPFESFDKRSYALLGQLHRSHLENLLQQGKYTDALEEVDDWKPEPQFSSLGLAGIFARQLTVCKIYRANHSFTLVVEMLNFCLQQISPQDTMFPRLLNNLADSYCDLGEPLEVYKTLGDHIEYERAKGRTTKALRRYLVSTLTAKVLEGHYDEAEIIISELQASFDHIPAPDITDQLLHIRTLISAAQIHHHKFSFDEAIRTWDAALSILVNYKSFKRDGFTSAVISISKSLALFHIGQHMEANRLFQYSQTILKEQPWDNWIPRLSEWVQVVQHEAGSFRPIDEV